MNNTIIQIWKHNGEELPFAVRRNTWSRSTYAVIQRVEQGRWPYGKAFGIYYLDGKAKTDIAEEISCAGCYQWDLVEDLGFKKGKYKGKKKSLKLYKKNDMFDFGKYYHHGMKKGLMTVEEVFKKDPTYIKWCLENVDYFCIDPDDIKNLNPEDSEKRIGGRLRKINYERFESLQK